MSNAKNFLTEMQGLSDSSLFSIQALSLQFQLKIHNVSTQTINSIFKCGDSNGQILRSCECGTKLIQMKHKCNSRICPDCANKRKKALQKKIYPFMSNLAQDRKYSFYFLTISPKNYSNLSDGIKTIHDSFKEFMRKKYIKDRIKAGFYVIEFKKSQNNTWNIHLHIIVYGRRLDNSIRGHCNECNQNLLHFDYINKVYYCANNKCCSTNVKKIKDSRLVRLWKKYKKEPVNIHITDRFFNKNENRWFYTRDSPRFCLNYMLKYITLDKTNFSNLKDVADFIVSTRKQRLISRIGLFYNVKLEKPKICCRFCKTEISLICDMQIIDNFQRQLYCIKPPSINLEKYIN